MRGRGATTASLGMTSVPVLIVLALITLLLAASLWLSSAEVGSQAALGSDAGATEMAAPASAETSYTVSASR
ncbi:MAG: hypothetical protein FJZ90_16350 [Chloroflexi bacterium]|nr:hypothetical protein [Chloroflexota bacterium]